MKGFIWPIVVLALVILGFMGLRSGDEVPAAVAQVTEQPRYVLRGAQWSSFDEQGGVRFKGSAANIDYFDDESARMTDFEATLQATGGASWTATAPEGYAPPRSRERMQLSGGVVGEGSWPDGEAVTFKTPDLWVDSSTESLETEARVEVQSVSRKGSARGLKLNGQTQQLTLLHDVEMRYVPR